MKNSHLVHTMEFNDGYFWVRLALTSVIGIVIAGALTLFMYVLIEASQQGLVESSRANILDFVRVQREESSQRKKPKPQRPQTQETPPASPTPQTDQSNLSDSALAISIPTANTNVGVDIGGMIGTGDGEYLPIVKVAPAYPIKAAIEGTEGNCAVEFTVTNSGATKDVSVVDDMCPSIFAKASINAAKKFKYKPRIVNGEAIEVHNVRNIFQYTLQDREVSE
ncbi:MAG: protein TonB [Alphaproteobacteria bacterium]|jgi:protein TonB